MFYLHACLFLWQRDGSGGVTGAMRGQPVMARLSGVRRTDGRTDGWMEISCYGERRTATGIEPRAVAHRRPASATSVSIRPSPATSPFPPTLGRLSTRNAAAAHANGKLENMKRLRERTAYVILPVHQLDEPAASDRKLSLNLRDTAVQNKRFTGRRGDTARDFIDAMCA